MLKYYPSMWAMKMVTCPKCKATVDTPIKEFILPRKTTRPGEKPKTTTAIGMFECPSCKTEFRATFDKAVDPTSIKSMVKKIKIVEGALVNTLKNLHEKIQSLETERSSLLLEIEELKKMAESKATALESEITMLREEVKSLKDLLGYEETEAEPHTKKR